MQSITEAAQDFWKKDNALANFTKHKQILERLRLKVLHLGVNFVAFD